MRDVYDTVSAAARARTVGTFIEQVLTELATALNASVVSFNRVDMAARTASVALRPYRPDNDTTATGGARLFERHPLLHWYRTQSDWAPVRISDVLPWPECQTTDVAPHAISIMLAPTAAPLWSYFLVNRADPDFSDEELAWCVRLQPALVALYLRLAEHGESAATECRSLTRREHTVLEYLADGLTADAIAHRLQARPATVRKHLQHVYAKLGTSDRLGAVLRGRDVGLLEAEDVSREFIWNIRFDW